uniref:Uncharacterized protein n=1 Tax=Arundo donax TaxID=35708 RepID=A0A0A8Z8K4_ARUDO
MLDFNRLASVYFLKHVNLCSDDPISESISCYWHAYFIP